MVGRVLLNQSGLKVSPAGVEVTTAAPGQLQFNSDWSALALHKTGDYALSWSTSGEVGSHSGFIPFDKTFPSPPSVWFYQVVGSYLVPIGSAYGFRLHLEDTSLANQPRDFYVYVEVQTGGIRVEAFYQKRTSGWNQPQMTFRYFAFEYNL